MKEKELLIKDIKARAISLYKYYYELSQALGYIKKTELNFEIVNSNNENGEAYAKIDENKKIIDYIRIDDSLIYKIYNTIVKIYNNFEQEFFNIFEKNKIFSSNSTLNKIIELRLNSNERYPSNINDNCCNIITIFAYRFVLLHELGHIYNGHCDYLRENEEENARILIFDKKEEKNTNKALCRRTLEYDADCFAGTQSIIYISKVYNGEIELLDKNINNEDSPFWYGFAIRILFLLFQDVKNNPNYYSKNMLYLPDVVRCINILDVIHNVIKIKDIKNGEKIENKVIFGMDSAEKCFNHLKYSTYSMIEELGQDNKYNEYTKEIYNNWEVSLKDHLIKYSRLNLFCEKDKNSLIL